MRFSKLSCLGLTVLLSVLVGSGFLCAEEVQERAQLRVGVYDSRAVAIAYGNSDHFSKLLAQKKSELKQAKGENDTEKIESLEAWGPKMQKKMHLQGFSAAPVHEYLKLIEDELPELASGCGVDLIVSKWEISYLAPQARVKDITDELVALFEPNERGLESISKLKDWEPVKAEQIDEVKD